MHDEPKDPRGHPFAWEPDLEKRYPRGTLGPPRDEAETNARKAEAMAAHIRRVAARLSGAPITADHRTLFGGAVPFRLEMSRAW